MTAARAIATLRRILNPRRRRLNFRARLALAALLGLALPATAQRITQRATIDAASASTWTAAGENVVLLEGPVTLRTDDAVLAADRMVVWLRRSDRDARVDADIVLLGNATVTTNAGRRTGPRLRVTARIDASLMINAQDRLAVDRSETDTYRDAAAVRAEARAPAPPARPPTTSPLDRPPPTQRVDFSFAGDVIAQRTDDGKIALIFNGGLAIVQRRANGDLLELRAQRAVVFSNLTSLDITQLQRSGEEGDAVRNALSSVYLEGDVRIGLTPAAVSGPRAVQSPEQRLEAERVFYELDTDRAVLTDAVVHTSEPTQNIPITLRADVIKQLTTGQWKASDAQLSTSTFARPGYSLRTSRVFVKQDRSGGEGAGRTSFDARDIRFTLYDAPVFYLPRVAGTVVEGFPLRSIAIENSNNFGTGVRLEWGLLELLGIPRPSNLDLTLKTDYLSERGPGVGIDGEYRGGYITETKRQSWTFKGDVESYLVLDSGDDNLGRDRLNIPHDNELRGRITWRHQHFFPDNWQLQARSSWVSDSTFLEEWYEREFDSGDPLDTSVYLKRQQGTEALSLLVQLQPNGIVTSADELQEVTPVIDPVNGVNGQNALIVEKLPEIGYRRIGDSIGTRNLTLYSDNTLSGMRFNVSRDTLSQQGFRNRRGPASDREPGVLPGYPAYGFTGADDTWNPRLDLREQIDLPLDAGPLKIVPYVFGRYTGYGDSPDDGAQHRLMAGAGVRASASLWRTYENVNSDLFDIHRLRHVIEPELHLFTSASTVERDDLYLYEQDVDGISDISAISVGVRQRFQTKRGAPGRERSVDFLTLNVRGTFYANAPDDPTIIDENGVPNTANVFRGVWFDSMPEASIARDTITADMTWRLTDTTAILADASYNTEYSTLATASLGVAAQRGERLSYYIGTRYIGEVNVTQINFAATYQMTANYSVALQQSYDISSRSSNSTAVTLFRRFDRFLLAVTAYADASDDEAGFRISLVPEGLGFGLDTSALAPTNR